MQDLMHKILYMERHKNHTELKEDKALEGGKGELCQFYFNSFKPNHCYIKLTDDSGSDNSSRSFRASTTA